MKAVTFAKSKCEIRPTIPKPKPQEDEVLIKVKYSALDTALDEVIGNTIVGGLLHKQTDPLLCGWHYSGVVEAVGAEVSEFKIGDDVYGNLQYLKSTTQGSLSEYVTSKADACALKPKSVGFDLAAAATTEPLTSLQALRDVGKLTSNKTAKQQTVLINGAAGQVGKAAIQIAKRMGAHVTAICSTKDVQVVTDLGADVVIDRKKTKNTWDTLQPAQFNTIFDTPGKLSASTSLKYLKPKGVYVTPAPDMLSFLLGKLVSLFTSKSVKMIMVESKKVDLELMGQWLDDGFQVDIDTHIYPIKQIDAAMVRNRESSKPGRVVIQVEDGW